MAFYTPGKKVRGLGTAGGGTEHFWAQRLTALALIPLVLWFVYSILTLMGAPYDVVRLWLTHPCHALAMILFLGVAFYHGYLGIRVIVEDYIHCECLKIFGIIKTIFVFFLFAAAGIFAVCSIYFKG